MLRILPILLIILAVQFSVSFRCGDTRETCTCYQIAETYSVICNSTLGAFDVSIKSVPKKIIVSIRCAGAPSWSDFHLSNDTLSHPSIDLRFDGCTPPGKDPRFNEQINAAGVKFLEFSRLKRRVGPEDLEAFTNAALLNLSKNNLGQVDPELLRGLPNLKVLNLQQTEIQVPEYFFRFHDTKATLSVLDLSKNSLNYLGPDCFYGLENLKVLNLWMCEISGLHPNAFRNLDFLESLAIQNNKLNTLPPEIFVNFMSLREINLSGNNFTSLADGLLESSEKLEKFIMTFNKANRTTLPSALLANKPNLKFVDLERSRLHDLPETLFWNSRGLLDIILRSNFLKSLPRKIFRDAERLETLTLTDNHIAHLPDDVFANCKKLRKLDLSDNKIESIGRKTLSGLKSLDELSLENNILTFIPIDAFESLSNLRFAKFGNNQITLDTVFRNFSYFSMSPFEPCGSLSQLDLSHNNVSELFSIWRFANIEKIDLSYNRIEYISAADFQTLSLKELELDLSNNAISEVSLTNLEHIISPDESHKLLVVNLAENPLKCGCEASDLVRYAQNRFPSRIYEALRLELDETKCVGPSWYNSTAVTKIDIREFKCHAVGKKKNSRSDDPCRFGSPCDCYRKPFDKTLLVDCGRRNLTLAPSAIDPMGMANVVLNLEGNHLESLPNVSSGYERVVKMNLSGNKISHLGASIITPELRELDLSNNRVRSLDQATMQALTRTDLGIKLQGNPWKCECDSDSRDFLAFVHEKKDLVDAVACGDDPRVTFGNLTVQELCPMNTVFYVASVAFCLLGLILSLLAALYYRFQRHVKVWLFSKSLCLCLVSEEELDKDKLYDAFVSYSHKDQDFVLNELVAKLEEERFRLCFHERDWLAGEWIPTQIARSVEESRRTIIVLSSSFLRSEWSMLEFAAAHKQALKDQRIRVIVVLYGEIGPTENLDPDLRAYLEMNTYVKWGDPWFWRKLKYVMPRPNKREQQTPVIEHADSLKKIKIDAGEVQKPNDLRVFDLMDLDSNLNYSMEDTIMEEKTIGHVKKVSDEVQKKIRVTTESVYSIGKNNSYTFRDKFDSAV